MTHSHCMCVLQALVVTMVTVFVRASSDGTSESLSQQEAMTGNMPTTPPPNSTLPTLTPAPTVYDCNFESDICSWTQDKNDQFDWTRNSGTTGSSDTGPLIDHTYENRNGHYIYIETSSPRRYGDKARLVSQAVTSSSTMCLHFWYDMYGTNVDTLNVYLKTGTSLGTPVWEHTGNLSNKWYNANVAIQKSSPYNIVFEGVRGLSFRGDIALDDISVSTGHCSVNPTQCFSCDDMTSLKYCHKVISCASSDQVCYVQKYETFSGVHRYRSGCTVERTCNISLHGECIYCCEGDYCNNIGCGDNGVQDLHNRGPFCFDCSHHGEHEACETVMLCASGELCKVERYRLGDIDMHYVKGCADALMCSGGGRREVQEPQDVVERGLPMCSTCCTKDFCNKNCTSVPNIVG